MKLSHQQTQIVKLIITEKMTIDALAHRLGISTNAARTQIERIYAKLNVSCRIGLANKTYEQIIEVWVEKLSAGWVQNLDSA